MTLPVIWADDGRVSVLRYSEKREYGAEQKPFRFVKKLHVDNTDRISAAFCPADRGDASLGDTAQKIAGGVERDPDIAV